MRNTSSFTSPKLKAALLLLSLCLMMVGTCPIQKLLSSTFSVKVDESKQPGIPSVSVTNTLKCAYYKEMIQVPLVELSTRNGASDVVPFLLLPAYVDSLTSFEPGVWMYNGKVKDPTVSSVPLFLRHQVFRI